MFAKGIAVLLCASLLALGASGAGMNPRHSFRAEHEYSFDYNGQIASSMSNGEQYSASRFRALVKLNFVTDKTVIVRLENPQMGQWNEYLDTPQELHKFDKFDRVTIKSEHLEKLNLPFQIRYSNGKINDITFSSEDITFSENIKRAIVNTLQVQLENPSEKEQQQQRDSEAYGFRLNETTIEGDCESLYNVRKVNVESESVDSYNVTKSIDFSQCRYRPELRYNYFRFAEPKELMDRKNVDDKLAKKLIHSNPALDISSVYEFVLNGDRRQFAVKESKVLSRYTYEMLDGQRVRMDTYAIAKISLKTAERRESPDSMPSTKSAESLVYSDKFDVLRERFIAEGDDTYLRQNPYMKMDNAVQIVSTIMKRLLESSTKKSVEGIDEQSTRYLTQLVSTLRLCSKSDIENIHSKLFENDEYDSVQKTFVQGILSDALAIAGTKHSIDHLFKKIQNGDISTVKAALTLSKLMNLRIVSSETVKNMENLCQESRIQDSETLKRTCWLTYGSMVNGMCKSENPLKHSDKYTNTIMNKYCDASTKAEITSNIIAFYNRVSARKDKILVLKTIGNMGLDSTVSFLETIIRDWNVEKVIRVTAIDALRQMRKEMPRRIQRILLPIFQDRREHPEIRMNALYQILHSRADRAVLEMIMTEMIREPNAHVKSFLNQLVFQMAEHAHELYDRETAVTLRSMLKHFRLYSDEERMPLFTSKFYSSIVAVEHNQVHELASQLNFGMLFSNDSRLPKEIMATMNLLSNNRLIPNTYQIGMHQQNIEQFIERLVNAIEEKDVDEILVRGRRSIAQESVDFLKGLYNRMKIASRRISSERVAPLVLFYTRHQDMDTFFCLTDEESLPELLQTFIVDGRVDVSRWELNNFRFNFASASYSHEQQIKLPTITGLPLLTSIKIPTITVLDGTVSTSFSDKLEEENHVRSARIHLKVEPKIATTVIIKMEVFSPLFTSGIKTFHSAQLRLPLNIVAKVHAPHWTPEIELHMPTEEVRILHLQTRPVTFYRTWPAKSGVFVEAAEKTLIVQGSTTPLKEKRINYVDPFLGLNVNIDSHWHASPLMASEKIFGDWLLSGENAFELKIQPTADSSKILKLSFKATGKKSKEIPDIKLTDFSTFYGKHTTEMLSHGHKDEQSLIREQMKIASGKLENFHHFVIKAEAVNGARPHVAKLDFTMLCDKRMSLCIARNNIDIDSEWTSKTAIELSMPEVRGVVAGFPSQHLVAKISTEFGSTQKSQIVLNVYGRPSTEKIEEVKRFMNVRDEKNVEYGLEDSFHQAPRVLKPNDFKVIVENKLSPKNNQYLQNFYSFLAFTGIVEMPQPELIEEEIKKSTQVLMSRIIVDKSLCNITISMPDSRRYSMKWDSEGRRQSSSQALDIFDTLRRTHSDDEMECSIKKGRFVRSFDGKSYKLPMTTCYTVIAKDCTEEPEFALMAKKLTKNGNELKLKLVTRGKTYELYKKSQKMVVEVNTYKIDEKEYEENGIFKVANKEGVYEIRCKDTGASARFDGINILARIGTEYANRQCGICGHMNFDESDDLRKADNEEAESLRDFHKSYLYRDSECDHSVIEALNKDSSEEGREEEYSENVDDDSEVQENIPPVHRTIVVEEHSRVCFSKKSYLQCPKGSVNTNAELEEVEFVCMKRSQHKTQRLLRQLQNQRVIELPEGIEEHHKVESRTIEIPSKCVSTSGDRRREMIQDGSENQTPLFL